MSGFWSGAGGGIVGGAISGLGNIGTAFGLQSESQDFAEKLAKKGIRWRVKDLRAAGLNPILAAQGALGGGFPGAQTPSAAGVPNLATAAQVGALMKSQKKELDERGNREMMMSKYYENLFTKTAKEIELMEPDLYSARAIADVRKSRIGRYGMMARELSNIGSDTIGNVGDMVNPFRRGGAFGGAKPPPRLNFYYPRGR